MYGSFTSMPRFRLVFDHLRDFPHSEIDTVIPLIRKIPQPIKSLSDLTRQLAKFPGCLFVDTSKRVNLGG
jgi:hypothetical protein